MAAIYLHDHKEFPELLRILEAETGIITALIEKDYWIMQALYGLKKQGYIFQLKGGTSLSKGFGLIDRFSEDIDLHFNPPEALGINENPKNSNAKNIQKKKAYYDQLAAEIKIDGIIGIERDIAFDDLRKYNSGGIRLHYKKIGSSVEGLKEGILLEAGYDDIAPNLPVTITSWVYEKAKDNPNIEIIDNRAIHILCYDPRYTFVEKLQTIATKFRKEKTTGDEQPNYLRQYYDVYSLLADKKVQEFIGTEEYSKHKEKRFPEEDFKVPINKNEAFLLSDNKTREKLKKQYEVTKALYHKGQPPFDDIIKRIHEFIDKL